MLRSSPRTTQPHDYPSCGDPRLRSSGIGRVLVRGEVTFTADATVERQGTLIALLFDYLRDAGLDPMPMRWMTFTTAQAESVSFTKVVHDANIATEVAAVMASN